MKLSHHTTIDDYAYIWCGAIYIFGSVAVSADGL